MLPLKNRLRKNKDFETVFRKGRGVSVGPVFLKFLENGLGVSRVGISVGLKFSTRAVKRALARRRLREIFHQQIAFILPGFDIVVVPQGKFDQAGPSLSNLSSFVITALKKANLTIKNKK
ncbi:MAG: ribonuclease P protein component [Patescibacteria group bacterium]